MFNSGKRPKKISFLSVQNQKAGVLLQDQKGAAARAFPLIKKMAMRQLFPWANYLTQVSRTVIAISIFQD